MYALPEVMIVSHINIVSTEPTPKLFQFLSFNVHVFICPSVPRENFFLLCVLGTFDEMKLS